MLWQLAPRHRYDPAQLDGFLAQLPRTHGAAAELAGGHDDKLREPAYLDAVDPDRPLEHVLEVRHPTFAEHQDEFLELLRRHRVGVVVADAAGLWPYFDAVTSPVVYVRLHGDTQVYVSGYGEDALQDWAQRIRRWARDAEVYVYFDNDVKVHAPQDAIRLAQILATP